VGRILNIWLKAVRPNFFPATFIPVGILIALVLYINEFPDYEADKAVNKQTLVVMLGKRKALVLITSYLIPEVVWV